MRKPGNLHRQVNTKTIFHQFLSGFLLVFLIPLLILFYVYLQMSSNLLHRMYQETGEMVRRGAHGIQGEFNNCEKQLAFLRYDREILNFYYMADPVRRKETTCDVLKAQDRLNILSVSNDDMINLQLYAARSDSLIDFTTSVLYLERYYGRNFSVSDLGIDEWRKRYLDCSEEFLIAEEDIISHGIRKRVLVYDRPYATYSGRENNRAIFYLNKDRLLSHFQEIPYKDGGFLLIADPAGKVLLLDGEEAEPAMDVVAAGKLKGNRVCRIRGNKIVLCWYTDTNGWKYTAAVPYQKVIAPIQPIVRLLLLLIFAAAVAGILLAVRMARKFSDPLTALHRRIARNGGNVSMEEFREELTEEINNNENLHIQMQEQMKKLLSENVRSVITGNITSDADIRDALRKSGIPTAAGLYVLLTFSWNDMDSDLDLETISAQKVYTETVICSIGDRHIVQFCEPDFAQTVVLLAYDTQDRDMVRIAVERTVQACLRKITQGSTASISVAGEMTEDCTKIFQSYRHTQKALQVSQNIFGEHSVQWYETACAYLEGQRTEAGQGEEEYGKDWNVRTVSDIQDYINAHFSSQNLSLAVVAREFYLTEAYVSKLFKRVSGENFSKYIEKIRMEKARELLETGNTVSNVARETGYNSPQVFRKAWKRYYGTLPSKDGR